MSDDSPPAIEKIESAIPEERKNMSFGGEGEGLIDVIERCERKRHERQGHDGTASDCAKCATDGGDSHE
jgi:hypothetical protein